MVKVIGRSGGRSAVASAAYRAAARLHDDALGRDHDYTQKAGVIHSEILLPEAAPERWADRGTLWNEVEAGEKRRDAQLARDIEIALPRELSRAEAVELARDFVRGHGLRQHTDSWGSPPHETRSTRPLTRLPLGTWHAPGTPRPVAPPYVPAAG